jgi:isoleucyl-tRNA synthetase
MLPRCDGHNGSGAVPYKGWRKIAFCLRLRSGNGNRLRSGNGNRLRSGNGNRLRSGNGNRLRSGNGNRAQATAIDSAQATAIDSATAVHFLAWTTTPWTLPSNTALCVGPKIEYVLVQTFNQYTEKEVFIIVAKDLASNFVSLNSTYKPINSEESVEFFEFYNSVAESEKETFVKTFFSTRKNSIPGKILGSCLGADLIGIRYDQLLPYTLPAEKPEEAFRVIGGDFVTTEDGTGIVHIAPTFGADDAKVATEAGVPAMLVKDDKGNLVPLVDLQGKFRPEVGELAGMYVKNEYYNEGEAPEKSVDVQIAIKLKTENTSLQGRKICSQLSALLENR